MFDRFSLCQEQEEKAKQLRQGGHGKKRGRPPKDKAKKEEQSQQMEGTVKKRRGRPPKTKN
jgi:hypothetical protein